VCCRPTPTNGAVDVSPVTTTSISVTFNEAVNVAAGAVSLICANANGTTGNLVAGGGSAAQTNVTSMTVALEPAASLLTLPAGATCTLTVTGALVNDVDTNDPPDLMPSDYVGTFTTAAVSGDQPPAVISTIPSDGATSVLNNVALRINFSEPVDAAAGSVQLTCGGSNLITGGTTGTGVTSLSPTYSGTLPNGQQCTLRVLASLIRDSDLDDPPDNMSADYVGTFTVASLNQAPYVTSLTRSGGGRRDPVFTVVFNEPVTLTTAGLATITCGATSYTSNVTVVNATTATVAVTPSGNTLANNATCVVRINRANVVDQASPPLQMTTSYCVDYNTTNPGTASTLRTCSP
jgi:large repetitive protein